MRTGAGLHDNPGFAAGGQASGIDPQRTFELPKKETLTTKEADVHFREKSPVHGTSPVTKDELGFQIGVSWTLRRNNNTARSKADLPGVPVWSRVLLSSIRYRYGRRATGDPSYQFN